MINADVVFPTPAGPENNMCGKFLLLTKLSSRLMMCSCPTTSENCFGRNLSVHMEWLTSPVMCLV